VNGRKRGDVDRHLQTEAKFSETSEGPLYRLVVPRQKVVVRINGLDPDTPEDEYLPAVRPYGAARMAWALWREVPGLSLRASLSLALQVCREGEAGVLTASRAAVERVGLALLAFHRVGSRLEVVG